MNNTKERIILVAMKLFSERGFDSVSTSMIAGELGITKGALYRHFESKLAIYDEIMDRMKSLEQETIRGDQLEFLCEDGVTINPEITLAALLDFINHQFVFLMEDEFAAYFRRMVLLDQFRHEAESKKYLSMFDRSTEQFFVDALQHLIDVGALNEAAKQFGAVNLSLQLMGPFQLLHHMADVYPDREELKLRMRQLTDEFSTRWSADQ